MKMRRTLMGSVFVLTGVVGFLGLILTAPRSGAPATQFGVSFSPAHATGIGLDWQATFDALLHDLEVRKVRLGAYWNQVEPREGGYDFTALDYQMDEAAKVGARVTLTVGRKIQRWPECHEPGWVQNRSESEVQQALLEMIEVVVRRYREHPALERWQVENEPFLAFGICPPADGELLESEVALVRQLDASHPILITDSGELNWWIAASRHGDIVGTTMYRTVFSQRTERLFSYDYLFPAWLYRAKARAIMWARGKDVIVAELQGEPWGTAPFTELSVEERRASMSPERMLELKRFAERTQLPEVYWWGVEYWHWEKVVMGEPLFWEQARGFF